MLQLIYPFIITFVTSFYSLSFTTIDGNTINMSSYSGKKILLVNIATSAPQTVPQLQGLQQLHQQYKDSLVIIGFASNSFGHEGSTNAQIKQFCQQQYGVSFQLAALSNVYGAGIHPVYNWLTNQTENGVMNGGIKNDFQKYLINKQGQLIGVFAAGVNPMDNAIIQAVTEN
jgi:glutathione peroxidase